MHECKHRATALFSHGNEVVLVAAAAFANRSSQRSNIVPFVLVWNDWMLPDAFRSLQCSCLSDLVSILLSEGSAGSLAICILVSPRWYCTDCVVPL